MGKGFVTILVAMLYLALDVAMFNAALVVSFALPYWVNEGRIIGFDDMHALHDMTRFCIFLPALALLGSGVYRVAWSRAKVEDYHLIFRSVVLADILLLLATYVFRAEVAGRTFIYSWPASSFIYLVPMACLFLSGWRLLLRLCFEREFLTRPRYQRMILVGLHAINDEILGRIMGNRNPTYQIVATFDNQKQRLAGVAAHIDTGLFPEVLEQTAADVVLVSTQGVSQDDLFAVIQHCERAGAEYKILPSYLDLMASKSRIDLINFVPMLTYSEPRITGWNLFLKMAMDYAGALLLLVTLTPFWILIMALIMLDSRGAPLYTQPRVGRYGKPFRIFKFRTMVQGADAHGNLTRDNDPRITRVGSFLRRWSIDELPQLANVLLGQMSLIGPRAVIPMVASGFDEWEKISLNVLPGMTGLAQVHGRNRLSFYEKSFLSVYYIRNYSLLLDIKILLRTLVTVFRGTGTGGTLESPRITPAEVEKELFPKTGQG
ncbi:MAG: sugar transferase [Planctomycetota bacterium]